MQCFSCTKVWLASNSYKLKNCANKTFKFDIILSEEIGDTKVKWKIRFLTGLHTILLNKQYSYEYAAKLDPKTYLFMMNITKWVD